MKLDEAIVKASEKFGPDSIVVMVLKDSLAAGADSSNMTEEQLFNLLGIIDSDLIKGVAGSNRL